MTHTSKDQQPGLFTDADLFTMLVIDEPVHREFRIKARELRPGDITLTHAGFRDYAAFDVDINERRVIVWTAVTDQRKGIPARLFLNPDDDLVVSRKTTTRIAVR